MPEITLYEFFEIIEEAASPLFSQSPDFRSCKSKMLTGQFSEITKKEYKEFAGAVKTAEQQYHKNGLEPLAFVLRRLLYHADEIGFPEIKDLKKKYKWSFI